MRALKALALTLLRPALAASLLALGGTGFAASTTPIATIESATTDGSTSSSVFQPSETSG